jgi:DNA polymerase-3 subunit delta
MAEEKPVVYILQGDDREAIESRLKEFRRSLGTPDMADMNTTRLEGKTIDINDLRGAALALPFLTERRLVIVEDALRFFDGGPEKINKPWL